MVAVQVAEMLVSLSMVLGPPVGEAVEGPAEDPNTEGFKAYPDDEDGGDGDPVEGEGDPVEGEGDPVEGEGEGEGEGEPGEGAALPVVDEIVERAAQAVKDRAWLERNGQEIDEYVRILDALADVNGELDTCARALQAELRMSLALAYLKRDETCTDGTQAEDDAAARADSGPLPLPVLECFEAPGPRACADALLEDVAAFAGAGPSGTAAPFAQAFGCSHAVAEMSVEQMFGACMVEQYEGAVERWDGTQVEDEAPVEVWPVPRWASIAGVSGGAALVIGGAVMLGINGKCPGGYDPVTEVDQCPSVYNTEVGGAVLVSVGALAMVGMGTVLAITEVQRSKQGRGRRTARLRHRLDRAEQLTGIRLSGPRLRLEHRP